MGDLSALHRGGLIRVPIVYHRSCGANNCRHQAYAQQKQKDRKGRAPVSTLFLGNRSVNFVCTRHCLYFIHVLRSVSKYFYRVLLICKFFYVTGTPHDNYGSILPEFNFKDIHTRPQGQDQPPHGNARSLT